MCCRVTYVARLEMKDSLTYEIRASLNSNQFDFSFPYEKISTVLQSEQ